MNYSLELPTAGFFPLTQSENNTLSSIEKANTLFMGSITLSLYALLFSSAININLIMALHLFSLSKLLNIFFSNNLIVLFDNDHYFGLQGLFEYIFLPSSPDHSSSFMSI